MGGDARSSFAIEGFRTILDRVFRGPDSRERLRDHFRMLVYTPQVRSLTWVQGSSRLVMSSMAPTQDAPGPAHGRDRAAAPAAATGPSKVGRTLSLWCFSASVAMRELTSLGVRSIILASGTLSPMEPYAAEMQVGRVIRRL